MEITATLVKELRDKTGVGMMQCKKALLETNGDMAGAIEYLRKKGEETAQKRAGKAAKEGKIATMVADGMACIVEVNSETDFVARNTDFVRFTDKLLDVLVAESCGSVEELQERKFPDGLPVKEGLNEIVAKIGEKISIRRFERMEFNSGESRVFSYIHAGGKIGVLVQLSADQSGALGHKEFLALGKDLTLQVAASNPLAVRKENLAPELVEKEKDIYRTQALNEGKPEKILERIITGKMTKYYQDVCLLDQPFVKETEKSVQQIIEQVEKKISAKITVPRFIRYLLGGECA